MIDNPVAVFGSVYEGDPVGFKGQGSLVRDTIYPPLSLVAQHYGIPINKLKNILGQKGFVVFRCNAEIVIVMDAYLHDINTSRSIH